MENINDIVNLISNNGVGIICLAYTLYTSYKMQNEVVKTLEELKDLIQKLMIKLEK